MSTYLLTTTPYPKEYIQLGSFIPDIRNPLADALSLSETGATLSPDDVATSPDSYFHVRLNSSSNWGWQAALNYLLQSVFQGQSQASEDVQISADQGFEYVLRQPKRLFRTLCQVRKVRHFLEESFLEPAKTHFVVGYRTFQNARLVRAQQHLSGGEGGTPINQQIQNPYGYSTQPPADLQHAFGFGLQGSFNERSSDHMAMTTNSERIYAILYYKINIRVGGDVTAYGDHLSANLEGECFWECVTNLRGPGKGKPFTNVSLEDGDLVDPGLNQVFQDPNSDLNFSILNEEYDPEETQVGQD